jgi:hypothetical protein
MQEWNFENLGARIMTNGALDRKICALEAFKGKTVFSRGAGGICGIFGWLESFGAKEHGLLPCLGFFEDFYEFLEGLEWFRTYL